MGLLRPEQDPSKRLGEAREEEFTTISPFPPKGNTYGFDFVCCTGKP